MRSGDWIATFTGRRWFITDPHPDDVDIQDIAHALSHICRYGGHCREFYSVAQHSVLVSEAIAEVHPTNYDVQLWGLLHDATEAYLGDMVRPLKRSMPDYKRLEDHTELVILDGLGVEWPSEAHRHVVKHFDDVLLMTERRDLVNHCGIEWTPRAEPLPGRISVISTAEAAKVFLARYQKLIVMEEVARG